MPVGLGDYGDVPKDILGAALMLMSRKMHTYKRMKTPVVTMATEYATLLLPDCIMAVIREEETLCRLFREEKSMYYNTCALCGANLDPGEKCNCQHDEAQKNTTENENKKAAYTCVGERNS